MIKQIAKSSKTVSPFIAVKEWELFNTANSDVVLIEPPGGEPEYAVALDYVDYSGPNPLLNRECDIALEQQEDDVAIYQEGVSGSGFFDPSIDDKNADGTFKRLVYDQTEKAFYNQYRNPLEIFGMENIDFPLSRTVRNIGDRFLLFTIPQLIMGDKLVPGTVQMYDTSLDDNVSIYDDALGNLVAGNNLFSKVQEVRTLGNSLFTGSVPNACVTYSAYPAGTPNITASQTWLPSLMPTIEASQVVYYPLIIMSDQEKTSVLTHNMGTITTISGTYFATDLDNQSYVYSSSDGYHWTYTTTSMADGNQEIAYGNGTYVMATSNVNHNTGTTGIVYVSSDGISWTRVDTGIGNFGDYLSIVFANGFFLMMGADINQYSTDGINWTASVNFGSNYAHGLDFLNGLYVASCQLVGVQYSTDGMTWTNTNLGITCTNAAYGNGIYLAVGGTQGNAISYDGTTWSQPATTIDGNASNPWMTTITFGSGFFVAGGQDGKIYTSVDAVNWTTNYAHAQQALGDALYNNGVFMVSEQNINGGS